MTVYHQLVNKVKFCQDSKQLMHVWGEAIEAMDQKKITNAQRLNVHKQIERVMDKQAYYKPKPELFD